MKVSSSCVHTSFGIWAKFRDHILAPLHLGEQWHATSRFMSDFSFEQSGKVHGQIFSSSGDGAGLRYS